jgi:hypothetical protein
MVSCSTKDRCTFVYPVSSCSLTLMVAREHGIGHVSHSEFLFTHYNGCKRTWNRTCFHSGILSSHYNGCQRHEIGRAFNRDNMPPRLYASKHVRTSLVVNMCNMLNSSEPGSTSTGCTVHGSDLSESCAMSKTLR